VTADDVVRVGSVVAGGLAAGVMANTLVGEVPTVRAIGGACGLSVKLAWDPGIERVLVPLLTLSIALGAAVIAVNEVLSTAAAVLSAVGLAAMIGALILSVRVAIPLERAMGKLAPERVQTDFPPLFERWTRTQVLRTGLGVGGFVCWVVALIAGPGGSWDVADGVRVLAIIAAAVAAGIQVSGLYGQIPAVRGVPEPLALVTKQHADHSVDRLAPWAVSLCPPTGIALLVIGSSSRAAEVLTIAALVCCAGLVIPTMVVNVPINLRMRGWSPDAVPPEFAAEHERWVRSHRVRTVASALGLACYVAAAVAALYG